MKTESLTLYPVVVNAVKQHYKFMKGVLGGFVFLPAWGTAWPWGFTNIDEVWPH